MTHILWYLYDPTVKTKWFSKMAGQFPLEIELALSGTLDSVKWDSFFVSSNPLAICFVYKHRTPTEKIIKIGQ